jgi:hypothetical protein
MEHVDDNKNSPNYSNYSSGDDANFGLGGTTSGRKHASEYCGAFT